MIMSSAPPAAGLPVFNHRRVQVMPERSPSFVWAFCAQRSLGKPMKNLIIEYLDPAQLLAAERNARTHTRKQIKKILRSLRQFGFLNPILVDAGNRIIAGHARCEAALLGGITSVPIIRIEGLTPEQVRMFAIAENRLGDLSSWSHEALALELSDLEQLGAELTLTGFDMGEIDLKIAHAEDRPVEPPSPFEEPSRETHAVTRLGDLWQIGLHRVICQDARSGGTYTALLGDLRAQMVITDSPYNVEVTGHVCSTEHREFPMASGEMSEQQFIDFLTAVMKQLAAFSDDGSIHFHFMDFRHMAEMLAAGEIAYSGLLNLCIWAKNNGGMGSLYRSAHELVFVFKSGKDPHINNVELGKHGRNRTNIWRYRGINSFGNGRAAALASHPTVKPIDLVADAILDCSNRDGIILDAFLGSGTTLVAAERTGRRGYGIELDPHYVDLALSRISAVTGVDPVHIQTGLTFAQLTAERATSAGEAA